MADNSLADLRASLRGELITRDDKEAFTAARFRGWNRDLNARASPLGFVVASGVRDIVTTINYCRSKSIPIAVRGKGAHSPYGMADDAVVIDLMRMTAVRVDPEKKLAFVQAGADGGDVDHETALHNLICITGSVSHTGFAGVALGGGLGHLSRWLGPVVDNIVGYEMVTPAGKVVRVDGAKDPELFWGMRGNGASFGIVTEFVVRLHEMPNDGIIHGGPILWPVDKAKEVMTSWMGRIARPDRRDTETLQFVFMHSPDGHPVCGVVPLIVGETVPAAKAACDELAAFGGGALVRGGYTATLHGSSGGAGRMLPVQQQLLGQGSVHRLGSSRLKRGEQYRGCDREALERQARIRLEAFYVHPLHGSQWSSGQG